MKNQYSNEIGFSPLGNVDYEKIKITVHNNLKIISEYYSKSLSDIVLVAGAGNGLEAVLMQNILKLKTYGLDINIENDKFTTDLILLKQDISKLEFPDNYFSLIYSTHVLEHVGDHKKVLTEFRRVLNNNGVFYIGFPNKRRIIGYIGATQKVTKWELLKWNLVDLKFKMLGKFENKYGAHAGFSTREFLNDAESIFSSITAVRSNYMRIKYSKWEKMINLLISTGLDEFIFPSNFFICKK
jgi:ubiquinone/menaquinone biosynthesis C-methylase UbiE